MSLIGARLLALQMSSVPILDVVLPVLGLIASTVILITVALLLQPAPPSPATVLSVGGTREEFVMRLATAAVLVALSSYSALAADFEPEIAPPGNFSWTGLYGGLAGGWDWGSADFNVRDCEKCGIHHDDDGIVLGGEVGAMYQLGTMFVLGAELQGLWTNDSDNKTVDNYLVTESDINALFLAKAKAGIAFDRFLAFGTVGYAGADIDTHAHIPNTPLTWDANDWANGIVFGAGVNYAFGNNWIVGVEWNRINVSGDFEGGVKGLQSPYTVKAGGDFDIDRLLATASFKF